MDSTTSATAGRSVPSVKALLASYMDSAGSSLTGPPAGLSLPPDVELSLEPSEPCTRSVTLSRLEASGHPLAAVAGGGGHNSHPHPHSHHHHHLSGEMIRRILERSKKKVLSPLPPPPLLFMSRDSGISLRETELWGEFIAAFPVGGEPRCCLPQILNSILGSVSLSAINAACDELRIYCPTCSPSQLSALKLRGIIPSTAAQCGLIRKTDAQRLFSLLLDVSGPLRRPGGMSLRVVHHCFGRTVGLLHPGSYGGPGDACLTCLDCGASFSPPRFVSHVHAAERAVVHWGFDSGNWRAYLRLDEDAYGREGSREWEEGERVLDEVKGRYANHGKRERRISDSGGGVPPVCPDSPGPLKKPRLTADGPPSEPLLPPLNNIYNLYNSWAALVSAKGKTAVPQHLWHKRSLKEGGGNNPKNPSNNSIINNNNNAFNNNNNSSSLNVAVGNNASANHSNNNNSSSNNHHPLPVTTRSSSSSSQTGNPNSEPKKEDHSSSSSLPAVLEDHSSSGLLLRGGGGGREEGRCSSSSLSGAFNSSLAEDISSIRDALEGASAVAKERTLKTLERITARLAQTEMERDIAIANLQDLQRQNSETVAELFKKRAELRELLAQDSESNNSRLTPSSHSIHSHQQRHAAHHNHPHHRGEGGGGGSLSPGVVRNNSLPSSSVPPPSSSLTTALSIHPIIPSLPPPPIPSLPPPLTTPPQLQTTKRKEGKDDDEHELDDLQNNPASGGPRTQEEGGESRKDEGSNNHSSSRSLGSPEPSKTLKDSEDLRERMVYMEAELRALRQELKGRVGDEPSSKAPPPPPPSLSSSHGKQQGGMATKATPA